MTVPFIRGTGPAQASVMVVTSAATADDLWKGYPLAGHPGDEFAKMMHEAGLTLSSCYRTCVLKTRAKQDRPNDYITQTKTRAAKAHLTHVMYDTFTTPEMPAIVEALQAEVSAVQPTVIVAVGDLAMWALTGVFGSVDTWRGSQLDYNGPVEWGQTPTVVPTYEPQYIQKMWHVRGFSVRDLQRVRDIAERPDLYRWPDYKFAIRPTYGIVQETLRELRLQVEQAPEGFLISCDIETIARHLSCIGLAWNVREALCIPLMTLGGHYWLEAEEIWILTELRYILTHPNVRVIGQNFNYDSQHFAKHLGFLPRLAFDTMIAQHVLFPGIPKALDFLSSMYCHFHRYWKDEMDDYSRLPENMEQYWTYNCLSGDTPVLDAYCRWRPLRDITIGDDLLTFEENPGEKATRKFIHAVVTNKASSHKEAIRVTFTDGTWLEGTGDHKVIAQERVKYRKQAFAAPIWKPLGELQIGEALPHVPQWQRSWEYEDGWVAGLVDGEGTLGHHSQAGYKSILISVAQREGLVADRFRSLAPVEHRRVNKRSLSYQVTALQGGKTITHGLSG